MKSLFSENDKQQQERKKENRRDIDPPGQGVGLIFFCFVISRLWKMPLAPSVFQYRISAGGTAFLEQFGNSRKTARGTLHGSEKFAAFRAHSVVLLYFRSAKFAEKFRFMVQAHEVFAWEQPEQATCAGAAGQAGALAPEALAPEAAAAAGLEAPLSFT